MVENPTFEEHDKLHRVGFAQDLTRSIEQFYPFSDDAYVLSLDAPFGSGKTMFVRMWQNQLRKREPDPFETIYFNAWKYDYFDDPTVPLLVELVRNIEKDSRTNTKALKKALAVVTVGLSEASKQLTGISPLELGTTVKELIKESYLEEIGGHLYEAFKQQQEVMVKAQHALKEYVDGLPKKPLFIFIDELDRARPDYAVKLLETLKHLFGVQGVCFVLSVDKKHLESSVRTMYGEGLDFENYYKKFVTRQSLLPPVNEVPSEDLIDYSFSEFFDEKQTMGVEFPFESKINEQIKAITHHLCDCFKFTSRQIREYFRTLAHFMAISHDITGHEKPSIDDISVVCIAQAIEVKDQKLNEKVVQELATTEDYQTIISQIHHNNDNQKQYNQHYSMSHALIRNLVLSLACQKNASKLARMLKGQTGEDMTGERLTQLLKNKYRMNLLPSSQHVQYRQIHWRMRQWKPFIA